MAKGRGKKAKGMVPTENPSTTTKKMKKNIRKKMKKSLMPNTSNALTSNIGLPTSSNPNLGSSSLIPIASSSAHASISTKNRVDVHKKEKDKGSEIHPSGFIFLCNKSTKIDCYKFRVFGLPRGQLEMAQKIKPGVKLFLFDTELKLLYGTYTATSVGELNLEALAFNGKYPAQVTMLLTLL